MKSRRDQQAARDFSDTLIQHRAILESGSIFGQGLTLLKIAWVVCFLYLKFKILSRIESYRARRAGR